MGLREKHQRDNFIFSSIILIVPINLSRKDASLEPCWLRWTQVPFPLPEACFSPPNFWHVNLDVYLLLSALLGLGSSPPPSSTGAQRSSPCLLTAKIGRLLFCNTTIAECWQVWRDARGVTYTCYSSNSCYLGDKVTWDL